MSGAGGSQGAARGRQKPLCTSLWLSQSPPSVVPGSLSISLLLCQDRLSGFPLPPPPPLLLGVCPNALPPFPTLWPCSWGPASSSVRSPKRGEVETFTPLVAGQAAPCWSIPLLSCSLLGFASPGTMPTPPSLQERHPPDQQHQPLQRGAQEGAHLRQPGCPRGRL